MQHTHTADEASAGEEQDFVPLPFSLDPTLPDPFAVVIGREENLAAKERRMTSETFEVEVVLDGQVVPLHVPSVWKEVEKGYSDDWLTISYSRSIEWQQCLGNPYGWNRISFLLQVLDAVDARDLLYKRLAVHEHQITHVQEKTSQLRRRAYWEEHVRPYAEKFETQYRINLLRLFFHQSVSNPSIQVTTMAAAWVSVYFEDAGEDLRQVMRGVMKVLSHHDLPVEEPTHEVQHLFGNTILRNCDVRKFTTLVNSFYSMSRRDNSLKIQIMEAKASKLPKAERAAMKRGAKALIASSTNGEDSDFVFGVANKRRRKG
eukprot:TRINITY_DN35_c0_g2_i2.p1 TRINITY_DN35_c0_g2~~TRINITY_DN35_c0_g2_i2.p1  ORF type:complete len:317 (+),score=57.17 TRINITY_DN35_c0_g2_i2:129-1079(+)